MVARKYTPDYCKIATRVLSEGKSLAAICGEIEITRSTLYEWRDNHPEFKEAIEIGLQKAQALWEETGFKGIVGEYDKFSSAPWVFTMKNRFRDDYAEEKESKKDDSASILEKIISGELKINQK